ncbi:hypothetical protein P3S68_014136 [Capsicum galapagoense]
MARNCAFYCTVALIVISVYLAESPNMKVIAARGLSAEVKSKLTGKNVDSLCGGSCFSSRDCLSRSCPNCYYDFFIHVYK